MKEHTETYSNLEQKMPTGAEEILKNGNVDIAHTAWDHWGKCTTKTVNSKKMYGAKMNP
jgi:hypothetical protein